MKKQTLLLLPLIMLAALTGIWAGWFRLGWIGVTPPAIGEHGAIMVGSFLGTLISLERAAALKNPWVYVVPLLSALSLVAFWAGLQPLAYTLLIMGSLGFTGIMGYFLYKYSEFYFIVLFAGAVCWLVGNIMLVMWRMYPVAVSWWMAFLLLTITAERLELSRYLPFTTLKKNLLSLGLICYSIGLLMPFHGAGQSITAAGMMSIALWLLTYDMALKSVKKEGVHRYSGILLITGYGWLLVTGLLMLSGDLVGPLYDAALHSFFVGFVFSMIFAHAPIILPAVLGKPLKPYHPVLYLWFVLLELSLAVRIWANLDSAYELRKWAGMVNGLAILFFFVTMAVLMVREVLKEKKRKSAQVVRAPKTQGITA
jgi:hypothetical protein